MRCVLFASVLAVTGCGAKGEPGGATNRRDPLPVTGLPALKEAPKRAGPKKPLPELKLTLEDARAKIVALDADGVTDLLGAPDRLVMGTHQGADAIIWEYQTQRVAWDAQRARHFRRFMVVFRTEADRVTPAGNAVDVQVRPGD